MDLENVMLFINHNFNHCWMISFQVIITSSSNFNEAPETEYKNQSFNKTACLTKCYETFDESIVFKLNYLMPVIYAF